MINTKTYLFALAISPDDEFIASVRAVKTSLRKNLNRSYISANSQAHITLITFWATLENYFLILEEFKRICTGLTPFNIRFSGYDYFPPKPLQTFYLKPDESASQKIIEGCQKINLNFRKSLKRKHLADWTNRARNGVHMSIGHELSRTEIEKCNAIASEGFSKSFFCDSFVIRKFNPGKGQYDIIDTIPLLGCQHIAGEQLNLF
jgi:2'-5' RNA ligase